MSGFKDGQAGAANLAGPADWGDLLLDGSFDDQPLTLTQEEERLFRSFGDGLGGFPSPFDSGSDPINERQVVYAEAEAAGVFKGGIRRAAFSMGDLQAFQLPEPAPASPRASLGSRGSGPGTSKLPRLASVPEAKVLRTEQAPPPASAGLLDDMLLSSRVSGLSMAGGGGLDSLALDHLSGDLLGGGSTSNPFASDAPMPLFGQPASQASLGPLPLGSLPMPGIKPEPGVSLLPLPPHAQLSASGGLPAPVSAAGVFDFPRPGSGSLDRKPPLAPAGSSSHIPLPQGGAQRSLQGFADELLRGMPPLPQPQARREAGGAPQEAAQQQQRERMIRRSQSAVELRAAAGGGSAGGLGGGGSGGGLEPPRRHPFTVELTTPDGHTYTAGRLSQEERAQKILRYRQKRHERNFNKRIKYMCRKTLADSRPRVRGRFARNDDVAAVLPHETKKALAEKARREKRDAASKKGPQAGRSRAQAAALLDASDLAADFPGLLADEAISGGGPLGGGLLPACDAFDFPPVPMELYSSLGSSATHFKPGSL